MRVSFPDPIPTDDGTGSGLGIIMIDICSHTESIPWCNYYGKSAVLR